MTATFWILSDYITLECLVRLMGVSEFLSNQGGRKAADMGVYCGRCNKKIFFVISFYWIAYV